MQLAYMRGAASSGSEPCASVGRSVVVLLGLTVKDFSLGEGMSSRCGVAITDVPGIRDSVEVSADTLFGRSPTGLVALPEDWIDMMGPATRLASQCSNRWSTHTVTVCSD
jgi:hypothetical protein